eukprot:SAG31_NODE_274_length_18666_cov_72.753972_8_plen_120_part_00
MAILHDHYCLPPSQEIPPRLYAAVDEARRIVGGDAVAVSSMELYQKTVDKTEACRQDRLLSLPPPGCRIVQYSRLPETLLECRFRLPVVEPAPPPQSHQRSQPANLLGPLSARRKHAAK